MTRTDDAARAQYTAETTERGAFNRQGVAFQDRITADGRDGFKAESGRYHLYVSLACPWAHRALIDRVTDADIRLFPTLVRFDAVCVGHFKCNLRRLVDYPNLWAYARDLYAQPGFGETTNFDHIRRHYYQTQDQLNPSRIVPKGPAVDWSAPHDRSGRSRLGGT